MEEESPDLILSPSKKFGIPELNLDTINEEKSERTYKPLIRPEESDYMSLDPADNQNIVA